MKLCVSSSIINFREKAEKTWKSERYKWPKDIFQPVVFFGMYHIGDYLHFLRHLGKKIIVWAGSDVISLINSHFPVYALFQNTECYCENEVEQRELNGVGIKAEIRPTFLEDINDFPICFKPSQKPQVYLSANTGREKEYGFDLIRKLSWLCPEITFHAYGVDQPYRKSRDNIVWHKRVSNEQFNKEIKNYQCGFRPNEHDGFSEIIAKSVLMGQYPISRIKYPMIDSYETEEELIKLLKDLRNKTKPNITASKYYRKNVNQFPFLKN